MNIHSEQTIYSSQGATTATTSDSSTAQASLSCSLNTTQSLKEEASVMHPSDMQRHSSISDILRPDRTPLTKEKTISHTAKQGDNQLSPNSAGNLLTNGLSPLIKPLPYLDDRGTSSSTLARSDSSSAAATSGTNVHVTIPLTMEFMNKQNTAESPFNFSSDLSLGAFPRYNTGKADQPVSVITSLGDSPPITSLASHAQSQSQAQKDGITNSLTMPIPQTGMSLGSMTTPGALTATPASTSTSHTLPLLNPSSQTYPLPLTHLSATSSAASSTLSSTLPILAMAIAPGATSPTAAPIPLDDSPSLISAKRHRALAGFRDSHTLSYDLPASGALSPPISAPTHTQNLTGMRVDFDMHMPDADPACVGMTSIGWKRDANGNIMSGQTRRLGLRLPGAVEALQTLSPATAMATALAFAQGTLDKVLNPQQVRLPPAVDTSDSGVKVLSGYEEPQQQLRYGAVGSVAGGVSGGYYSGSLYGGAPSAYSTMGMGGVSGAQYYATSAGAGAAYAASAAMYARPPGAVVTTDGKYPAQMAAGYGYMSAGAGVGGMGTPTGAMYKQSRPYAATTSTSMSSTAAHAAGGVASGILMGNGVDPYGGMGAASTVNAGMGVSQYGYGMQYQMYGTDTKGNPVYMSSQMPMQMMHAYPYQNYMTASGAAYAHSMTTGTTQAGMTAGAATSVASVAQAQAHAHAHAHAQAQAQAQAAQAKGAYSYSHPHASHVQQAQAQAQMQAQYPYMYYQYYPGYDPSHAQASAVAAQQQQQQHQQQQQQMHATSAMMQSADPNTTHKLAPTGGGPSVGMGAQTSNVGTGATSAVTEGLNATT